MLFTMEDASHEMESDAIVSKTGSSEDRPDMWLERPFKSAKTRRLELIAHKAEKTGMYKESIAALKKLQKQAKEEYRKKNSGQFGLEEQLEDAERLVCFKWALQKSVFLLQKYPKDCMMKDGATLLFDGVFGRFNKDDYSFRWAGDKILFNSYNVEEAWSGIEDRFHLIKSSVTIEYTTITHSITGSIVSNYSECLQGEGWGIHLESAKNVHTMMNSLQLVNNGNYNTRRTDTFGTHSVLTYKFTVPILAIMHKDSLKDAYTSHYDEAKPVDIQTWINSIAPATCYFSKCTF